MENTLRREIFAAAFRDRIVHHLLIRRLNPYFERYFIDRVYLADKNGYDGAFEKSLCRTIIFNNPCNGCIFKSPRSAWNELPANKSLFHAFADDCVIVADSSRA